MNGKKQQTQILMITSPAGETAKVVLPVQEDDDLWTAIDRAYPEAYDILEPGDVDTIGDSGLQLDRWDILIQPGQGQLLADWFCEIPEDVWPQVMAEADLGECIGEWDEGDGMRHPVQPGTWRGHGVVVTYGIGAGESVDGWTDADFGAHVAGIRIVGRD